MTGRSRRAGARRHQAGLVALIAFAIAATVLAGCGGKKATTGSSQPSKATQLKVMEFNIEYGGTQVSFKKVVEAVKAAAPDVVGLEEAETNTARLAKAIGYQYYSNGMQIVSKYPILEPSADGSYAFIEVQPGYVVALSNVHLPSAPYGVYAMNKGKTADQVTALEQRVRVPALQKQLQELPQLAAKGIPTFLLGDFNSPSGLDYTAAMVGKRPQIKYAFDWPAARAVLDSGMRDSWRDAHPDPIADPGLTWPAARPHVAGWNPKRSDPADRIDFIYAGGPSTTVSSVIVGEKGGPEVSIPVDPWPSDHRAVVSTFEVQAAPTPVLVSVSSWLLTQGEPLTVIYKGDGKDDEKVVVVPAAGDPKTATMSQPAPAPVAGGAAMPLIFDTAGMQPGGFEVALVDSSGTVLAKVPFWVQAKGAKTELTTDKPSYASGDPITVSWLNAPANRWDWLGVYKASAADPNNDWYLIWQYTGGAMSGTVHGLPAGSLTMQKDTVAGKPWPLPPGKYVVYYLLADAYESAAQAEFTVTK